MPTQLELRSISKRFGKVAANSDVSFSIQKGSIHGIVGENGAGKSTIMKIVYGLYKKDSGSVLVNQTSQEITSPQKALALGIGMVQQHFTFVPTLSVWENIILGSEPTLLRLTKHSLIEKINTLQQSFGFSLDLEAIVENLPVGLQQQVEILKVLYQNADLLIFDEPTAVLTPQEVTVFFERLKALNAQGKTLVIITHKLKEILSFTQSVTIMRQGKVVETLPTATLTENTLAEKIIGRKHTALPSRKPFKDPKTVLQVRSLSASLLKELSFEVKAGEIVGIAGIEGNGQQELCEILANVQREYKGEVNFLGRSLRDHSTYSVKQKGLAVIPPDRHHEGVILDFTVEENAVLGHQRESRYTQGIRFSFKKRRDYVEQILQQFDVRPPIAELPMRSLSGGNQQKVVVGRETITRPHFLLAAHPTRGVDIGAIEFIHSHFLSLREQGTGILLLSSELDEILALSDRILVLYKGAFSGETTPQEATEGLLGKWMTGGST